MFLFLEDLTSYNIITTVFALIGVSIGVGQFWQKQKLEKRFKQLDQKGKIYKDFIDSYADDGINLSKLNFEFQIVNLKASLVEESEEVDMRVLDGMFSYFRGLNSATAKLDSEIMKLKLDASCKVFKFVEQLEVIIPNAEEELVSLVEMLNIEDSVFPSSFQEIFESADELVEKMILQMRKEIQELSG